MDLDESWVQCYIVYKSHLNIRNFYYTKMHFSISLNLPKEKSSQIPCPHLVCPTINADIVIETIKLVIRIRRQCPYRHRIPERYSCNPLIKRETRFNGTVANIKL